MSHSIQVYHLQPLLPAQQKLPRQQNYFRDGLGLLIQCLVGQYSWFALAFLLLVVSTITAIFVWRPVAYLLDYLVAQRSELLTQNGWPAVTSPLVTTSIGLLIMIVLLALLENITSAGAELMLASCGQRLGYHLRMALFTHLQQISSDQQSTNNGQATQQINELLRHTAHDMIAVENFVTGALPTSIGNGLLLLGTLLFFLLTSREMALLSTASLLVLAFFFQHFAQQLGPAAPSQSHVQQGYELATITQDILLPVHVGQPYSNESYTQHRFAQYNQKTMTLARQAAARQVQFTWSSKSLELLVLVLIAGLGLWLVNQASITVGLLLILILMSQRLFKPLRQLIQAWSKLDQIYASLARIGALLDPHFTFADKTPPEHTEPVHGLLVAPAANLNNTPARSTMAGRKSPHALRPTLPTLQNAQLSLMPGETLAIVCPSTVHSQIITELLANLQISKTGQILIGHRETQRSPQPDLPTELDIILHDPLLFEGSVTENIAYGCPTATQKQIRIAACQANANAFIENLPQEYATLLGELTVKLSPAERYCLAIARACLRNAPILVLEIPHIDWGDDQVRVTTALFRLMQGKTILVVTDDQAQIEQADQVVVFQDGKIVETRVQQKTLRIAITDGLPFEMRVPIEMTESAHESLAPNEALDLRNSLQLAKKFPGISIALDSEAMRAHLQTALIGPLRSRIYTITHCTIKKASYQTRENCMFVYALEVREHTTGQIWTPLLLAQLFATPYAAKDYLRGQVTPLAEQVTEYLASSAFVAPFALIDALNMVVQLFPLDSRLPTLINLTNPEQMVELFQTCLPEAKNRRFLINECVINVIDYAEQAYCRLRYQIDGNLANSHKSGRQVLYGKVSVASGGALTGPILDALRQRMQTDNVAYRFQLPHFVAYEPALQLVLVEAVRGLPQLPALLTTHLQRIANEAPLLPDQPGVLTWEKALDASARIATFLHTSRITLGQPRRLAAELADLQAAIAEVRLFSPTLASRLTVGLTAITAFAATTTALPLCFSHGDFTPDKPLFEQTAVGLMDFDHVCQAEPALDLGQFQAALRLSMGEAAPKSTGEATSPFDSQLAEQCCTQFLQTYIIELGYSRQNAQQLHRRVQVYELISLLQIILHSWQTFETEQLEHLVSFLQGRLASLDTMPYAIIAKPASRSPPKWPHNSTLQSG